MVGAVLAPIGCIPGRPVGTLPAPSLPDPPGHVHVHIPPTLVTASGKADICFQPGTDAVRTRSARAVEEGRVQVMPGDSVRPGERLRTGR